MPSESPPCHLHAIKTVWTSVEPYLDLQSTIRASQACRALHAEIIDPDTQKIKVSRFSSRSGPWDTVPYYLPLALNAIHFPSLRRVELGFAPFRLPASDDADEDEEEDEVIDDSASSCLPLFVSQLAHARNLETLLLSLDGVFVDYNNWRVEPLLLLLGRNLARCKRLRDLYVVVPYQYNSYLMRELLISLTQMLVKKKDTLCAFSFALDSSPDPITSQNPEARERLHGAAAAFFLAVLSCVQLESLVLNVQHSHVMTNALLDAVKQKCTSKNYSTLDRYTGLRTLHLDLDLGMSNEPWLEREDQGQYLESAHLLFDHFSSCKQLRSVHLHLPLDIWADQIDTIASMLSGRPHLESFSFLFCGYADDDGKAVDFLEKCFAGRCDNSSLQVQELRKVDGRRLFQLMECARTYKRLEGFASAGSDDEEEGAEEEGGEAAEVERPEVGPDALEEDMPEKVDIEYMWLTRGHSSCWSIAR